MDGIRFVTPRSWMDLSDMLHLYELHKMPVDVELTGQYLQDEKIARNFASYYDLFNKYRSDYQVESILQGNASEKIIQRAQQAPFDERFSLISLLMTAVSNPIRQSMEARSVLEEVQKALMEVRKLQATHKSKTMAELLDMVVQTAQQALQKRMSGSMISAAEEQIAREKIALLQAYEQIEGITGDFASAFSVLHDRFNGNVKEQKKEVERTKEALENTFAFCETAFGNGQEMLIFVTELTRNAQTASFISTYGSDAYFRHNKELLFYERQGKVIDTLKKLDDPQD